VATFREQCLDLAQLLCPAETPPELVEQARHLVALAGGLSPGQDFDDIMREVNESLVDRLGDFIQQTLAPDEVDTGLFLMRIDDRDKIVARLGTLAGMAHARRVQHKLHAVGAEAQRWVVETYGVVFANS
jgi:hypothetical protein